MIGPVIFFHTHFAKEYLKYTASGYLHIYIGGHHFRFKALVDTGNRLYEPLTGKPVCLVEYAHLKQCMQEKMTLPVQWAIPYHTIGQSDGMLWGFTADEVIFQNQWQKIRKSGCIIAIYPKKISKSGDIMAIVHPDILKK